ncbi:S8 family serine peptidase [Robertmurraya sp. DFI.2.37]|uniref:S8 family peptidase n=1 Tax=Robertmurraya sp. DFI.2.37 TaxID=3031819 RepID=UPI0012494483|nr:S8 family serine peptidase [Robertmurraya sp. DFI.2.37]MDF1507064.1 S8 family serine peptidase [Robertmurraya sp. DFI.2.37]
MKFLAMLVSNIFRYKSVLMIASLFLINGCVSSDKDQKRVPQLSSYQQLSNENLSDEQQPRTRYLLLFKKWDDINIVLNEYNGVLINVLEQMPIVTAFLTEADAELLKKDARITLIERDKVVEVNPVEQVPWFNNKVISPSAWGSNFTGKGIKIAVIDTGVSQNHEDILIAGGKSFVNYTNFIEDDNGHGTHVIGIIGAKKNDKGIIGVAYDSKIYALKALNHEGIGYLSSIISAIDWAIENQMDIINLSLGIDQPSFLLQNVVERAVSQNITVVASVGNAGTKAGDEDTVTYPARYQSVIGVGAIDENNQRAIFSSTGSAVELTAPGVMVLSAFPQNDYVYMSGTSMAAPIVTGIIALIKEANPSLSTDEIRGKLQKSAIDLGVSGRDQLYGFGLAQSPFLFRDIYGHWANKDILNMYQLGWMVGTKTDVFSPDITLTRGQCAVIIVRALKLTKESESVRQFSDVPNGYWAKAEIDTITQHKLMMGTTFRTFSPNRSLTRAQFAVILDRIMKLPQPTIENPFKDVPTTHWALKSIVALHELGVVNGTTQSKFNPEGKISRAQMAAMMNRAYPYLLEK